jgi:hypothetical protein
MRSNWVTVFVLALFAVSAVGQAASSSVGTREVVWSNESGEGSANLASSIYYPAAGAGINRPIQQIIGGHPVVVFLHGWGRLGSDYYRVGNALAEMGIVAVMMNTGQQSFAVLERDARAMFSALEVESNRLDGFWEGAFDMRRVGLMGHSMGGAVMSLVLNESPLQPNVNPGYVCGMGLAPANPAIVCAGFDVRVPVGVVSGQGDLLTPPQTHAVPFYGLLKPDHGLKFHYQFNANCTHMNLVGLEPGQPEVFFRTRKVFEAFFGHFLLSSLIGLEAVMGVDGYADQNVVAVDVDTAVPQAWCADKVHLGSTIRVSVAAEPGFAGLIVAGEMGLPTLTSIGTLLLDTSSAFSFGESFIFGDRLDVLVGIPNEPELIGCDFAIQGVGGAINSVLMLGSALSLGISN